MSDDHGLLRVLYDRNDYLVLEFTCHGLVPGEQLAEVDEITFPISGAYVQRSPLGRATADPTQVVFTQREDPFELIAAVPGSRMFVVSAPQEVLREALGETARHAGADDGRPFGRAAIPCSHRLALARERLVLAARGTQAGAMAVEERCLRLLDVLGRDLARLPATPPSSGGGETAQAKRQRDRVEAVIAFLAEHLGESLDLATIASHVHVSPYHLCRIFRSTAGTTIHHYLTRLKLQAALRSIAEGARDLSRLAHDLGFADHAHFSHSFKRHFGAPPSAVRSALRARPGRRARATEPAELPVKPAAPQPPAPPASAPRSPGARR